MTIITSFRLKTYFKRSFQHSVSIFTNILAIPRMIPSPAKYKQTKTTQQQIHSHLKKVHVSRFPVVLNEAIQEVISVVVNKHIKSSDPLHKTVNERTSSSPAILKQTAPQELDKVPSKTFYVEVTKRNGDTNELESLKSCRVPLNGI